MYALRPSRHITTLVLIWFLSYWCAMLAATALSPGVATVDICTAGGELSVLDVRNDHSDAGASKALKCMDCPLCTALPVPSAPTLSHFSKVSPWVYAKRPTARTYVAAVTAPPLPPRGPPLAGGTSNQLFSRTI